MQDVSDEDRNEEKLILKHALIRYEMLTEIYHWLQSKSKAYPWIDNHTFREKFIKKLDVLDVKFFNMQKFEVLMSYAKFTSRFDGKLDPRYVDIPHGISRFMFIELLFRIAKFLYSTTSQLTKTEVHLMRESMSDTERVLTSQAFY